MGEIQYLASLIVFNLFFLIFIVAIITFIKQYRLKKKEHLDMIERQKTDHQKEILTTQVEMQQQTMQEIGREIHDNVGQKLTLASIYSQQLAAENSQSKNNSKIEAICQIINESLLDLRQLSKSLADDRIEKSEIYELIEFECKKANLLKICKINPSFRGDTTILPYATKSVLIRIIQEFIQNSIKYSKCENINISFENSIDSFVLNLKDDGIGFDILKNNNNGIGLKNMRNRARIIGGIYSFKSDTNNGTHLTVKILK